MVERRGDGNGKFRMGTKYTVEESKGPISKVDFEQIWSLRPWLATCVRSRAQELLSQTEFHVLSDFLGIGSCCLLFLY